MTKLGIQNQFKIRGVMHEVKDARHETGKIVEKVNQRKESRAQFLADRKESQKTHIIEHHEEK